MRDGTALIKTQFPNLNSVPSCGSKAIILDCPYESQSGCLTQTKGKHMSKMCSNIPVQDCQVANGVEYCYCRGELCNKKKQAASNQVPKPTTRHPAPPAAAPVPTASTAPSPVASKAPNNVRDARNNDAHKEPQPSTAKPERPSAAAASRNADFGVLAALAFLFGRHILT
ncbi:Hypothetical predicted protein [Cloeon dipterum]|nr:Hypothetical predicted protein [Cloeon dipterum]